MRVISEDYTELNRQLHEADHSYGNGSWKWSDTVDQLRIDTGSDTVLDYGCGKGYLKRSLSGPEWLREYDPAVPGKDARPERADLVVCTDVLEHVEPDLIDNVIADIADLSMKSVFIVVATRQAKKTLADGRNAHLIIEDEKWWRAKLEKRFFIQNWSAFPGELSMIGATARPLGKLDVKSAVSDTIRYENAVRNCAVVKDRVDVLGERNENRVVVCGYGPSLTETWQEILREKRACNALVVSTSGAHDFLIERGIIPDIHTDIDPRAHKAHFTRNPHPDVKYYIASCVHPTLIDNLLAKGAKVALWHVYNNEIDKKIVEEGGPHPGGWLIMGGGSVGCRTMNMLFAMGYRSFSYYGMDCSFAHDGSQHAGEHTGKVHPEWLIRPEGTNRVYRTSGNMVATARHFVENYRSLQRLCKSYDEPFIPGTKDRLELFMYGDSMLTHYFHMMNVKGGHGNGADTVAEVLHPAKETEVGPSDDLRSVA